MKFFSKANKPSFEFRGFQIPVDLLWRTGGGPESFEIIAQQHLEQLESHAPIQPEHRILELASGIGRDAMLLATLLGERGQYDGFDIDQESIGWCRKEISRRHPNFRFHHADIRSTRYNPAGTVDATAYRFPAPDGSVDRALAQSLFTHLLPEAVAAYLAETRRVLKPGGIAAYTFFTGSEPEVLASSDSQEPAFRITLPYSPGCFISDRETPEASVAYESDYLASLIRDAGLEMAGPVVEGCWIPGRQSAAAHAQDLVFLRLAAAR